MIEFKFNANEPHQYVAYARMSSERQNPLSPDDQFAEIEKRVKQLGHPWTCVGKYRDDAVSGRYTEAKRPGLRKLLSDIRGESVRPSLLLVDTYERLGRNDDLPNLRKRLRKQGVLILSADGSFSDPTTPQGQFMNLFHEARAIEENRVKAHQVLRGKRASVARGCWGGGFAPLGYRLETLLEPRKGGVDRAHRKLVIDPATAPIVQRIFAIADRTGRGQCHVCRLVNEDPEIPSARKPFNASHIGRILANPIYVGTLVWGRVSTDIVDDMRVSRLNAPDDRVVVESYCEPIVDREVWERVNQRRERRGRPIRKAIDSRPLAPHQIARNAGGLALKYPLSGLVVCGECGHSMVTMPSPLYRTKDGEERRYVYHACPATTSGNCSNRTRIPEDWLRRSVIEAILDQLLR